ncbi:COX assembly mitochondrial protein 2 [Diutina catenulata]
MHPQLDKRRFDTCDKLMDALEECHRQEFLKQALGMCNFEKDQLAQCLHYTRVSDSKDRIRASRERQKGIDKRRKEAEEEAYGKNGYLKKVIEAEMEKNKK